MSTRAQANPPNFGQSESGALSADSPEVVVNGVFLSPRVIDRRAYGELSGELRDLVERSAAERAGLSAALEQASRAAQDFRQREASQSGNLELAARALRTFEERTVKVEALLIQAADQTKIFEKLEAHAGGLIDAKIQILESRLEAVNSAATAKTEALEERVRRASRELEQRIESIRRDAESIAGPAQEGLARLCEKASTLSGPTPGSLTDLIARGEKLAVQAESIARGMEQFDQRTAQARLHIEQITERQDEIEKRTIQMGSQVAHRQAEIDRRTMELAAILDERYAEIERRAADLTSQVEKNGLELTSQMERRSLEITTQTERRTTELGTQAERNLEIVRSRLTHQQNESIARAQSTIDEAQRLLDQVQSGTPIADLRSVIQQSADAHSTTALAIKVLDKSVEQARGITAQLEPWRGLLDSHDPSKMPEPIRRMVECVRGDLLKELSSIAGALRNAADRADRAVRGVAESSELAITPPPPQPAAPKASAILKASAPQAGHPLVGARVATPAVMPEPGESRRGRSGDAAD